jgi:hypothetical protein
MPTARQPLGPRRTAGSNGIEDHTRVMTNKTVIKLNYSGATKESLPIIRHNFSCSEHVLFLFVFIATQKSLWPNLVGYAA